MTRSPAASGEFLSWGVRGDTPSGSIEWRCTSRSVPQDRAVSYTRRNIKQDLEDIGSRFDGAPELEFRAATKALELEESALSYLRIPPGNRFPYGHTHKKQEEVYVVLRGSGRMKLDDELVELKEWDAVGVAPSTCEVTRPGRKCSRSSSSARPISATRRARTSTASATGGSTSRAIGKL
jgi:mannose-6-phosphate isomerase-like protein (cupin superfamily)